MIACSSEVSAGRRVALVVLTLCLVSGAAEAQPTPAAVAAPAPVVAPVAKPAPVAAPVAAPGPVVAPVTAPEVLDSGVVRMTLAQAVELALSQQSSLRQVRAQEDASRGRVELARVPLRPTAQLGATASVGSTPVRTCAGDPSQSCGGFFDPATSTGVSAQVSWRLYDFGQTAASIRAAETSASAAEFSVRVSELEVKTAAEQSYLEAVARHHLVVVAQAAVDSELLHLEQARGFVAAGARDPIEVAQAQARAASARSQLAQAQSNQAVALGNLRAAIGWLDPARQVVTELTWPAPTQGPSLELPALVAAARARRPELAQLDRQIAASDASVAAAQAGKRPVLSAFANSQWGPDSSDWTPQPSWTAGVSLSWTAWDGGRAQAEVRIARANLRAAVAQRDALLVSLTAALEVARARIVANLASVQASTEAVSAAQSSLHLAEARYGQGLGGQIEVADAQAALTAAQGSLVLAEWQLADAWAELRRATGQ
ncbi:MAG: TolC family protein [Myxococcales bacterium]|nr:TolC family protein [Myxococcales bacterium]